MNLKAIKIRVAGIFNAFSLLDILQH